jgi:hypothetical protein
MEMACAIVEKQALDGLDELDAMTSEAALIRPSRDCLANIKGEERGRVVTQ